jgi:excisionase family DNA binding protein
MVLTVEQAAQLLHLRAATVRRLAVAGRIPGAKVGKCWRFVEAVLRDWLARQSLENVKPCPSDVVRAPPIGKFDFSSLDERLEALLAHPTDEKPSDLRKSFVVVTGGKSS